MAVALACERFTNAVIDIEDMTIAEITDDAIRTYDLAELLKRWDGIAGINFTIHRSIPLRPDGRGVA